MGLFQYRRFHLDYTKGPQKKEMPLLILYLPKEILFNNIKEIEKSWQLRARVSKNAWKYFFVVCYKHALLINETWWKRGDKNGKQKLQINVDTRNKWILNAININFLSTRKDHTSSRETFLAHDLFHTISYNKEKKASTISHLWNRNGVLILKKFIGDIGDTVELPCLFYDWFGLIISFVILKFLQYVTFFYNL